ncbi:rho guanine nucleotide exchange factor 18 isoform X1 [Bufo bufo]|uniref:rho guanine nucleotide exchange factor 18 isoform X1 n=1 Tax=Bufo bufo TaxID=8384 RepID=UPI001ABE6733|nr:rho guanine nucleotide exchange factor 18 isoform X1 [Bufo bufo]
MVHIEPDVCRHTVGLNVSLKQQLVFKMSDSVLNNSWPSFSKLWMKRWSFKRASECKPCPEFAAIPDSRSVTPDAEPSPPTADTGEMFFLPEEKDDQSLDLEKCCSDTVSSDEDLHSLDSALHGTEYYKDLIMMEDKNVDQETTKPATAAFCVASGPNISFDNGEVVITYTKPFLCPMTLETGTTSVSPANKEDGSQEELVRAQEAIPILVRSLSTSRRHSWDDAVLPTDTVRRFSLDASEMESDLERELEATNSVTTQEIIPLSRSWTTKANLRIEADIGALDLTTAETENKGEDNSGKRLRSKSMPSTLDKISTPRISRSLESSCPVIEVIQPPPMEVIEKDHVEPTHVLFVQQVLQELKQYHGTNNKQEASSEPKQNLTWFEFLSNETEDTGKPEKVERGTKVKRRLSSLKNRVTGSWQKDKGKMKEQLKEKGRDMKDKWIYTNGHELVPGCFSSHAKCTLCTRSLVNGRGLQCMHCAVNVHKNCKALLPECTSSKTKKDGSHKPVTPSQISLVSYQQASFKDHPRIAIVGLDGTHVQARGLGMTVTNRGNSRVEIQATSGSRNSSTAAEMDELDSNFTKMRIFTEDNVSLAPSTTESVFVEDAFYSSVRAELESDAVEFEFETWSSAVEPPYAKKQKKEVIKRQDVIYELMQTEMHHVRTLKIMLKVYSRALREELHGNKEVHQLFPCLDELLELHEQFLARFKERRKESLEEGSDRNYIIQKVGDILVQQFSADTGERMKNKYGVFCSQHNKAVGHYKFLMRENKKFQNLMKKIGNSTIVRRLGVLECLLLVTQRITKYPVLVERIIQNTEEGTEDFVALTQALTLIKEVITDVDCRVHKSEKGQRLDDIIGKMEPKSYGKLKNGVTFRKHDMEHKQLIHDGMLYWKTASGRLKDILAVLLTDVLLLLQEKDQKYIFSSVDAKPPVISLQKLIVREVANEEKAMFLISASLNGPEMYEIHTTSKEERNSWMTFIRGAVESCPDEGTEFLREADEERKQASERAARIKDLQDRLNKKDTLISQVLNEKLQICMDMAELYGFDESSQGSRVRVLAGSDNGENSKGEYLLLSAIAEVETIETMLLSLFSTAPDDPSSGVTALPRRSETFGGYDSNCGHINRTGSFNQRVKDRRSETETQDLVHSEPDMPMLENQNPSETEIIVKVQTLIKMLYSLQALIAQQDSFIEVQREREKQFRQQSRGNWLLEQEKQRNFEKQREEFANVQKLQDQLKQERQRWEREKNRHQKGMEATEMMLRQREEASRIEMEKLKQERIELEAQREAYQHDLERLREAQKAVEKDRERLEQLKKIKKPVTAGSFTPDLVQVTLGLAHSASFNGEGMQNLEGAGHLGMKPSAKTSASVSAADYLERPEVTRRDSNSMESRPALKNDVPIHLLSATNQIQKPSLLTKQQIPTKLATLTKSGRDKSGRGKASHRTESSASIGHRPLIPSRTSEKDDSTAKARRAASPGLVGSQVAFFQQELSGQDSTSEIPTYPSSLYRQSSGHLLAPSVPPPAPPADEDTNKEDVIFF